MSSPPWLRTIEVPGAAEPITGVILDVHMSPYDIPEAVRGVRRRGRFRIEFRYIDGDEPSGPEQVIDQHLSAFEGRHSGRLLALEVDIDALGAQAVGLSINALNPAWSALESWQEQKHGRPLAPVRHAVQSRQMELMKQLAVADHR